MKKVVVLLCLWVSVVLVSGASARDIQKGSIEIDGIMDVSFLKGKSKAIGSYETETEEYSVAFSNYYYIEKNIGAGLFCDYGKSERNAPSGYGDTLTTEATSYLVGPVIKYQYSLADQINIYLNGGAGMARLRSKNNYYAVKGKGTGWKISAGLSFFLKKSIALNLQLERSSIEIKMDDINSHLDVNDTSLRVGASVYID